MSLKLLIIDDDELDRKSIVRALRGSFSAIEFLHATTAKMGLEIAKTTKLDIILLDYMLPDLDGLDIIKQLRESESEQTAIIMLSHQDDETLSEKAIMFGAQDFLRKDEVKPERLKRVIHQARYRHQLENALRNTQFQLQKQAESDSLTGLANRYRLDKVLQDAIKSSHRGKKLALMLLDLDHFKEVNDTFGHSLGDKLLIDVTQRLHSMIREGDLLARIGGDEFVVVINDIDKDEKISLLVSRIIEILSPPFKLGPIEWSITASIGVAILGDCADNSTELLKCADIAMYRAKQEGRNQCHFYSEALHAFIRRRMEIERDLKTAINMNQLEVFYQPQMSGQSGSISGMEALLRWNHPTLGLLFPGDFLPIAEETGLMPEIGAWVLKSACLQLRQWLENEKFRDSDIVVAVNLSALQLDNKDLVNTIKETLEHHKVNPRYLELEITENLVISNTHKIAATLSEIAALGVKLSLDDFGTGYSSFDHLKLFPIHTLKIDRSFVSGVGSDDYAETLLAAIVKFGKTLGLKVIAEGVETLKQVEFCKSQNCDMLQGFFYDRALPAGEFEQKYLSC